MLSIYALASIVLFLLLWCAYNTIIENNEKAKRSVTLYDISAVDQHGKALFYNLNKHCYIYRKPTFWEKRFLKYTQKKTNKIK